MNFIQGLSTIFGFNKNYNLLGLQVLGGSGFSRFNQSRALEMVLQNPAMVKVIALQCDMFSLGKFYYYEGDKEKKMPDELAELLKKPNYQSNIRQFLWDWMFWNMLGQSWIYVRDKNFHPKMWVLNSFELTFPPEVETQPFIFSKSAYDELGRKKVTYYQKNGKVTEIEYRDLIQYTDLTNSPTLTLNGISRLESLYKIIANSEEGLKAKNINTRFSGKFLVAGKVGELDVSKRMLGQAEKDDIETKVDSGDQAVHAVKSMIEIRRFVENMKQLELSKAYLDDYFLIGNMYNIPRDVLEAYESSTFENQEKARASHVAYCLDPKGEELGGSLSDFFSLSGTILMSWDHLPFVQVMEKDREETKKVKLENLKTLLDMGVSQKEALAFVDLTFKPFEYGSEQETGRTEGEGGEAPAPEGN